MNPEGADGEDAGEAYGEDAGEADGPGDAGPANIHRRLVKLKVERLLDTEMFRMLTKNKHLKK